MKPTKLDAIIWQLYEAPTDISRWTTALTNIGYLVNCSGGGQFHLWDEQTQRMLVSCVPDWVDGSLLAFTEEYNERFAASDPRRRMVESTPPGVWQYDQDRFDQRFISRSEIHHFLRQHNIGYTAGVRLATTHTVVAAMGVMRSPRQGVFGHRERRLLDRLSPHLVRAADLTLKFQELREKAELGASVANVVAQPLIVADRRGHIVFENQAATRLLRERRECYSAGGNLRASRVDDDRLLHRAIMNAVEHGLGSVFQMAGTNGEYESVCRVVPLPESGAVSRLASSRTAVISITRKRNATLSPQVLRALFGLTAAESDVVIALQTGSSVEEISATLGIAITTVRSHLKQAFLKTGTGRQAELVALLKSVLLLEEPQRPAVQTPASPS